MNKQSMMQCVSSRTDALKVLGEVRKLSVARAKAEATRQAALLTIDNRFKPLIEGLDKEIAVATTALGIWAAGNPSEFVQARSIESADGTIGFRLGNHQLRPLAKQTWKKILNTLKAGRGLARFIRTKEEVNKQLILDRREEIGESGLRAIGVRVVQEDTFFVEPKLDEVPMEGGVV